jgi:hypothetical protein
LGDEDCVGNLVLSKGIQISQKPSLEKSKECCRGGAWDNYFLPSISPNSNSVITLCVFMQISRASGNLHKTFFWIAQARTNSSKPKEEKKKSNAK